MSKMECHDSFRRYAEMIVNHPNYHGLFYERDEEGNAKWVVTGKSAHGKRRQQWWDEMCVKHGIKVERGCYAKIALLIHPTKKHVCQCCGKELSIYREYPNKTLLARLNALLGTNLSQTDYTIGEIVEKFCDTEEKLKGVAAFFRLEGCCSPRLLKERIYHEFVAKGNNRLLSPGVMSNSPDRFDGFHSYGLCCRKTKDKGRHDDNMKTYTQDRRAYEEWADGDWNLANRLMGEFHKVEPMPCPVCGKLENMSADHIGPISLGFCHSKFFAPMCKNCNSAKNNRFTKLDVDKLLALEAQGEQVVSWHSKCVWDVLKLRIKNDEDAKRASAIMAKCHQNVLWLLALLYKLTGKRFLMRYLHPQYAYVDYRFNNVDLPDLTKLEIVATRLESKNKKKNEERYLRIAFESLGEFMEKINRRNELLVDENDVRLLHIVDLIGNKQDKEADQCLRRLIADVSMEILSHGI